MSRFISHSAVRGVVMLLMSLSAVGFTSVVRYCTMSRSAECCCAGEHENHPMQPTSRTSLGNVNIPCDVRIVAGGLAPVALNIAADAPAKILVTDLAAFDARFAGHLSTFTPHRPFAHSDDAAPPQADIYIRTCSLLI